MKQKNVPRCCNRNSDNLITTITSTVRYSTTELSEDNSINWSAPTLIKGRGHRGNRRFPLNAVWNLLTVLCAWFDFFNAKKVRCSNLNYGGESDNLWWTWEQRHFGNALIFKYINCAPNWFHNIQWYFSLYLFFH